MLLQMRWPFSTGNRCLQVRSTGPSCPSSRRRSGGPRNRRLGLEVDPWAVPDRQKSGICRRRTSSTRTGSRPSSTSRTPSTAVPRRDPRPSAAASQPVSYSVHASSIRNEGRKGPGHHIGKEIIQLCEVITDYGYEDEEDGTFIISFGELFNIYNYISDKVISSPVN